MIDKIRQKIQKLIGTPINEKEQKELVSFRFSFVHKLNSMQYHLMLIRQVKKHIAQRVDIAHQNKKIFFADENRRESIALTHQLEFEYTTLMEDIIQHTTSAIDNLPLLIGIYYKGTKATDTFNSTRKALNHEHREDLKITKYINENWAAWIEKVHDFRGLLYHKHSSICVGSMKMTFGQQTEFKEEFIITIPHKMRAALGYPEDKEVEIEEFCSDVVSKAFTFFDEILDIITKEKDTQPKSKDIEKK